MAQEADLCPEEGRGHAPGRVGVRDGCISLYFVGGVRGGHIAFWEGEQSVNVRCPAAVAVLASPRRSVFIVSPVSVQSCMYALIL